VAQFLLNRKGDPGPVGVESGEAAGAPLRIVHMSLRSIAGNRGRVTETIDTAEARPLPIGRGRVCAPVAGSRIHPEQSGEARADQSQSVGPPSSLSSISVVVPVYNGQATLPTLIARLEPVLASLTDRYEVVLVNDGSRDPSWAAIQELAGRHGWVRGINLMRNYGQHNALLCGIRVARFDTIVTMDDDLEHPPEEIYNLLAKLEEGFDVVYGFPQHQQHGLLRDLASELTKLALRSSMGAETARHISAFRAFRTRAREAFADYHSPFVSIDVVLTWATTRFAAIEVRHDRRLEGFSNYTFRKLFTHAMNLMTGFSTLPLQAANLLGLLCTAFGGFILLYVVGRFLCHGTTVPGFTFLASIIAIFSGTQLVALGIIGEYLARMHFRMMERPTYTVREELGLRDEGAA
jgi:glycosyltransferase involved in cell wall biosynthesis